MNLGQLKRLLNMAPDNHMCKYGFGNPHSYRGYYDEVSFAPTMATMIKDMKHDVERALKEEFTGWKGGEFRYDESTPVHFAFEGECESEENAGGWNVNIIMSILGLF